MSDLSVAITGFVAGDNLEIRRTVTAPPAAIAKAWLTIKRHTGQLDSAAALQKTITVTDVPGTGQIVDAGGGGDDADLRFDLTAADTLALGTAQYVHDVQVLLASGEIYTVELGTIRLAEGVTRATS